MDPLVSGSDGVRQPAADQRGSPSVRRRQPEFPDFGSDAAGLARPAACQGAVPRSSTAAAALWGPAARSQHQQVRRGHRTALPVSPSLAEVPFTLISLSPCSQAAGGRGPVRRGAQGSGPLPAGAAGEHRDEGQLSLHRRGHLRPAPGAHYCS